MATLSQTILWTSLPHGVSGTGTAQMLNLSVYASLRLSSSGDGNQTLNDFDDCLNWTEKVKNSLAFSVVFDGGPTIPASSVNWDRSRLDPGLWTTLFQKQTLVTPYKFKGMDQPILSYPTTAIEGFIRDQYSEIAVNSPTAFPDPQDVANRLGVINLYETISQTGAQQAEGQPRVKTSNAAFRQGFMQRIANVSTRLSNSIGNNLDILLRGGKATLKPNAAGALESITKDLHASKYSKVAPGDTTKAFMQFALFHAAQNAKPAAKGVKAMQTPGHVKPTIPQVEFHEAISSLGDYPELMKILGLVIELQIPYSGTLPPGSAVYVVPTWSVPFKHPKVDCPSKTILGQGTFWPSPDPSGSDIKGGLLDLSDQTRFEVVQLDVDGAAFKLMQFAELMEQMIPAENPAKPVLLADAGLGGIQRLSSMMATEFNKVDAALPSLRSTGISVVKADRPLVLLTTIDRSTTANQTVVMAQQNPAALPTVASPAFKSKNTETAWYADQLIRGYRIDVWDSETKAWHPLCKRRGYYTIGNNPLSELAPYFDDEGFVGMAVSQTYDHSQVQLRMPESLFKWDGWSLSAPRVGKTVDENDQPIDPTGSGLAWLGLRVHFEAQPGTLPRLRFGTRYRLRARVVDLAGNSRLMEEFAIDDFQCTTDERPYVRFEPVSTPAILLRNKLKPGESVEHLVIRSNYDKTAPDYEKDKSLTEYPDIRHVLPPRVPQVMAEMHRKFDGMAPEDSYKMMISKDGSFGPPVDTSKPTPPFNYETSIIPDDTQSITIPYLPDPIARGVALTFYDRTGKLLWTVKPIDFYSGGANWPDPLPFQLRVMEGDGEPQWERDGKRVLTVLVPKAEKITMRYSSYLSDDDLKAEGIWNWIERRNPSNKEDLRQSALKGSHWMLTPFRESTIVHAVQQPLDEPKFDKLIPVKEAIGATYALLHARITDDAKSTVKVDVTAEWDEPLDDLLAAKPDTIHGKAHVFDLPIGDQDNTLTVGDPNTPPQLEGGTTGTVIEYFKSFVISAVAPYRKSMHMAKIGVQHGPAKAQPVQHAMTGQTVAVASLSELRSKSIIGSIFTGLSGVFAVKKHEFGDTKYRKVRYSAVATTRFREYFLDLIDPARYQGWKTSGAPAVVRSIVPGTPGKATKKLPGNEPVQPPEQVLIPLTRESSVEVKVMNSARPTIPQILYVIPMFTWETKEDEVNIIRRRCGGGLRVYMERPWYSSGDEEMLGVLVAKDPSALLTDDSPMKSFVTQWGLDPIWKSTAKLKSTPALVDFPEAKRKQQDVSLAELSGAEVHVAGHDVTFDEKRRLWYSDIVVDPGAAYFPFIRLGLARYQPNSIADCFISRVVLTDYIQIIPDRVAAVTYESNQKITVQVAGVFGLTKGTSAEELEKLPHELMNSQFMTATIERRVDDGDLGWIPVAQKAQAKPGIVGSLGDVMPPEKLYGSKMLWSKEIQLPEPLARKRGQNGLRVVIKEYEMFQGQNFQPVSRLTYADVIEL